jgi:hypothetical protein
MKFSIFKILIITIFLAAFTVLALFVINQKYQTIIVEIPKFSHQATPSSPALSSGDENPKSVLLPVPFTPQAPTANWDELHNEACEEASAIMAAEYYKDTMTPSSSPPQEGEKVGVLPPDFVEDEITNLTKWQQENFGYYLDATSAETALMIEKVYDLKTKLIENFSADDLKKELAQNHLVLISEYGRALGNPYYKRPGPIHHMLVIKGYNSAGFVTNDPGTKRGLNYFYDFKTLYNAAADWDHAKTNIDSTKKIAIIVWK